MGIRGGRSGMGSALIKRRKLSNFSHVMRKGDCLEKGDHAGHCFGRPRMRWIDNMDKWAKMSLEKLLRETEDRRRLNILVHEATNPRNEDS